MIPGPYSICQISFPPDGDCATYTTIRYGYDTADEAFDALPKLAHEEGISAEELVVIKFVERDDEELD